MVDYQKLDLPFHMSWFGRDCPGVPSRLSKCLGISLQLNFQNELQPNDALLWNNSAHKPFAKLGAYCCINKTKCNLCTILMCSQIILKQIHLTFLGNTKIFAIIFASCMVIDSRQKRFVRGVSVRLVLG